MIILRVVHQLFVRRSFLDQIGGCFRSVERKFRELAFFLFGEHVVDQPVRRWRIGEKRVTAVLDFFHPFGLGYVLRLFVDNSLQVRIGFAVFLCVPYKRGVRSGLIS